MRVKVRLSTSFICGYVEADEDLFCVVGKQNGSTPLKSYINDEAAFRTDLFNDHATHDKMTDMMRQFLRDGAATKAALKTLLQAK